MIAEFSVSTTPKRTEISNTRAPGAEVATPNADRSGDNLPIPDNDRVQKNRDALLDRMMDGATRKNLELRVERGDRKFGFIYTVLDKRTGEVVDQWPHDVLVARMPDNDFARGLLVDQTA